MFQLNYDLISFTQNYLISLSWYWVFPWLSAHFSAYCQSKISMERHFKEIVGLLPKQFLTITRFNHAYFKIVQSSEKEWFDVVSEFNYFDQSHFIKEFKRYSGFTPSQLHQSLYSIAGHVKELELRGV